MFNMQLFPIQSIVKDAGFGASVPIIVKANNKEYILKTQEDGMQPKSLGIFNEVLAYQLIDYLDYNISPQEIVFLHIDENFVDMAKIAYEVGIIKEESYKNIQKSLGVNIGIEYLHNAMDILGTDIDNKSFKKDIIHIDNYIMNCDRTRDNINILQDKSNLRRYYAIDFGNALADGKLYENIVNGDTDIFTSGIFHRCNVTLSGRYILKDEAQNLIKIGFKNKDDNSSIRDVLSTIIDKFPPEWEPIKYKDDIIDIIAVRLKSREIFKINDDAKCECLY